MIHANPDRLDDECEGQKIHETRLEYCRLHALAIVKIRQEISGLAESG